MNEKKSGFRKCPRNDDLLLGQPRLPLGQAFSHSIGGQQESVR